MFSAVFLVCSLISGQCMIQGPQTQFFNTIDECNQFAFNSIMKTDLSEVRVIHRCVGWGIPA